MGHQLSFARGASTLSIASLASLASLACITACDATPAPRAPGNAFAIAVAPITLATLSDACYSLATYAAVDLDPVAWSPAAHADTRVWSRSPVCASDFGIGSGGTADLAATAISYVGACDASIPVNSVVLSLDALYRGGHAPDSQAGTSGAGTALISGVDFYNPCPASEPCILEAACAPFSDTPVGFDLTVMRNGGKGFFDVSVTFEDIFCSAKFDCAYGPDQPIRQVIGADGEQHPSAVLGFACTAGTALPSHLYMSDLRLTCTTGGIDQTIDVSDSGVLFSGPHPLPLAGAYPSDAIFQAVVSLGRSSPFAGVEEFYWNVSLGFDLAQVAGRDCTLSARATATEGTFDDTTLGVTGLTPAHATYPYVDFEIPVSATTGPSARLTCGGLAGNNKNPLNGDGSSVRTRYTHVSERLCFDERYPGTAPVGSVSDAALATTCVGDLAGDDPCADKLKVVSEVRFSGGVLVAPTSPDFSLACVEEITSQLRVQSSPSLAVELPRLTKAGGLFQIQNSAGASVSAPLLTTNTGALAVSVINSMNASMLLPALTSADSLFVTGNGGVGGGTPLVTLDFGDLVTLGSSLFTNNGSLTVSFPALTSLTDLSAINGGIASFVAPNLATVGDLVITTLETDITLPSLTSATGQLALGRAFVTSGETAVALPALTTVGGNFSVFRVDGLSAPLFESAVQVTLSDSFVATWSLPSLTSASGLSMNNNASLTTFSFPLLAPISDFIHFQYNAAFAGPLSLPTAASLSSLQVVGNATLAGIELASLVAVDNLELTDNDLLTLTAASFPLLDEVSQSLYITDDPLVPQCEAQALFDALSIEPTFSNYDITTGLGTDLCGP